jgi:hypothetical protein
MAYYLRLEWIKACYDSMKWYIEFWLGIVLVFGYRSEQTFCSLQLVDFDKKFND